MLFRVFGSLSLAEFWDGQAAGVYESLLEVGGFAEVKGEREKKLGAWLICK
jgi:hypothetical protein